MLYTQVVWLLLPEAVEFGAEGEDQFVDRSDRLRTVPTRGEGQGGRGGREEEEDGGERRKKKCELFGGSGVYPT